MSKLLIKLMYVGGIFIGQNLFEPVIDSIYMHVDIEIAGIDMGK